MSDLLTETQLTHLSTYRRIYVALSGGVDSVVLLHRLQSNPILKPKLMAVHINHQLQLEANQWQRYCEQLCHRFHVPCLVKQIEVDSKANVEANARDKRYQVLKQLVDEGDALLTAHHADDQVETFFLNLFRGAGINGLACMPDKQSFAKGVLLRPLLALGRDALIDYAKSNNLTWVDDPSNLDCRFQRNWLRHEWLPLLKTRWPGASQNILRSIHHIQSAFRFTETLAQQHLNACLLDKDKLAIETLLSFDTAEQRDIVRAWLKQHQLSMPTQKQLSQLFDTVIHAQPDAVPEWRLCDHLIRRYNNVLYVGKYTMPQTQFEPVPWSDFPDSLQNIANFSSIAIQTSGDLPAFEQVEIRFRQGGEQFKYKGKTRSLKKLFQQWHIPPWQRDHLPLLFIDNQLTVVADLAVNDNWQPYLRPLTLTPTFRTGVFFAKS